MKLHATIRENNARRDELYARLTGERARSGWAHQHELWPCVRKGAAERWLLDRGRAAEIAPTKLQALYFLRGNSIEALIADANMPRPLLVTGLPGEEIACTPDQYLADPTRPIAEIKSTNFSSYSMYKYVKAGGVDMTPGNDFPMRNYFDQLAIYCAKLGVTSGELWVYFQHGDYADRRTKCPECGGKLGGWDADEHKKACEACGYVSKKGDLWTYDVDFDPAYLRRVNAEINERARQFYPALEAADEAELMRIAPATQNYHCHNCPAGKLIGCAEYGKAFK